MLNSYEKSLLSSCLPARKDVVKVPRIVIDETRCKGCALCTVACPRGLIGMSDRMNGQGFLPASISEQDLERCTSCTLCAQMCPDVAIRVYRPRSQP